MGARWYDARIGRWISADTIVPDPGNPQSLNRYSYVENNPAAYIDP
ncbi:MAG: RHS repeat-associated core domain-containing protein, partial [Chloroflexi bacterium]|nr:RHS repeat-associated core domain-containing protein [Chloroflexota bacterium]